ncbi:MAG: hypothetical protein ACM31C_31870 [Acidobacteriota bacterium]
MTAFDAGMTIKLLLASLVFASTAAAQAAPTPPPPPSPHVLRAPDLCRAKGDVLFEIDHRVDVTMNVATVGTSELVVDATGAWTFDSRDGSGKPLRSAHGCLADAQMRAIRADLARATWQVKRADTACAAIGADLVHYYVRGRLVWTERMCQIPYLDETSRRSLDEITKILDDASAPRTPPCCKK